MIADCEEYGLRTPEFIQAEDFRTIIWRKEKVSDRGEKVTKLGAKVTEQGEKVTKRDANSTQVRLTAMMGVLRPTTTHKNDSNRKYITAHDGE